MSAQNTKILVVPLNKEDGLELLLDDACRKEYGAGRKEQNYWLIKTDSQFAQTGDPAVGKFNAMMLNAFHAGYQYIQITFK